jgi:hypothetical protein
MAFQFRLRVVAVLAAIGFERFHIGVNVKKITIPAGSFTAGLGKPGLSDPLRSRLPDRSIKPYFDVLREQLTDPFQCLGHNLAEVAV